MRVKGRGDIDHHVLSVKHLVMDSNVSRVVHAMVGTLRSLCLQDGRIAARPGGLGQPVWHTAEG